VVGVRVRHGGSSLALAKGMAGGIRWIWVAIWLGGRDIREREGERHSLMASNWLEAACKLALQASRTAASPVFELDKIST
jgi:hypothetical protein